MLADPYTRRRWLYALLVAVTIALGLGSRAIAAHLPAVLAKSTGDALYATMAFFAIGVLAPRARTRTVAAAALAFSFAIECTQLLHAPWLDAIRATLLGRLVLGQGFHALDLLYYAVGVALAAAVELGVRWSR